MKIQENIKNVEVNYNGNEKAFNDFLKSAIKGYISDDSVSADDESEDGENAEEDVEFGLAI